MRTRITGGARIFHDAAERIRAWDPVGDDESATDRVHVGYRKQNNGYFDLAPGESFAVPLGDIDTPCGVEVRGDADVRIAINGGAAITCSRDVVSTDVDEDLLLLFRARITSITISLPGDATRNASGRVAVWGEPIA